MAIKGLAAIVVVSLVLSIAVGCGSTGLEGGTGESPLNWKERGENKLYASVSGPARSFIVSGVVNEPVVFGYEASASERRQASRMVIGWMAARSKAAWGKDCSYLSQTYKRYVIKDAHFASNGHAKNCPEALAYFGTEASGNLVDTTTGPIDSLRIEGTRGYALYHGRNGIDWSVTMQKEKGKWRVAVPLPEALKRGSNSASAPEG